MDKQFWLTIRENKFAFPPAQDLRALTEELFSYIPSADPELRDTIGYDTFSNWIETERYAADDLRKYISRLCANMQIGLGERDTDTVFGRTFSVLFLAEVIHRDNQRPYLESHEVADVLDRVLNYFAAEKDARGFVAGKGWAHALAHTADMLVVFARSPHMDGPDLLRILESISTKLKNATNWVYIHGEDDRLARAVVTILGRDKLSLDEIKAWLDRCIGGWQGAWTDESRTTAYFNTRNFLRAVHLRVASTQDLLHIEELSALLLETATTMRPF